MVFNSYIFIFIFLPICIVGYFWLNRCGKYTAAKAFVLFMSMWFYGYYSELCLVLITFSIVCNYAIYRLLQRNKSKILIGVGVLFNVGFLVYFKYMNFLIDTVNKLFRGNIEFMEIILPLGISFISFQQISFLVDTYRGEAPQYAPLDYALFVLYFPKLIAGPIVSHKELLPQFEDTDNRAVNWDNISSGLYLFTLGLTKKVLFAESFGRAVDWGYSHIEQLNWISAIAVIVGYTLQIYFDFSGYCDMAVGISKMMNIELPINFNSPYKAATIEEFWERWHMTLTRFLTRYVYIPLGGNRKGIVRTYINILLVFLVSGIWHGASWNFVLWGLCHGVLLVLTKCLKGIVSKVPRCINCVVTFGMVNILWVFFRAYNIQEAIQLLKQVTNTDYIGIHEDMAQCFTWPELSFAIGLICVFCMKNTNERLQTWRPKVMNAIVVALLLVINIYSLAGESTFVYFNF